MYMRGFLKRFLAITGLLAGLQGCGGGGADSGPTQVVVPTGATFSCLPVGGGAATITAGCVSCRADAVSSINNAIDGDLTTAALVSTYHPDDLANQQTIINVTAKAQDGVVFPALSKGGVAMQLPTGLVADLAISVVTYLDGKVQSTHNETVDTTPAGDFVYVGFDTGTSIPFDAVELILTETQPNLEEHVYRIFEFCGDGGLAE
jgi:hypothetical protein